MLRFNWISVSLQIVSIWVSLFAIPSIADDASSSTQAQRIISLDYCADQYLLKFVEPERILAVSLDATRGFSYMRETAKGLKQISPRTEEVLIAQPDLVIRSYGGGPNVGNFLTRAGIDVVQIGYTGSLKQIEQTILEISTKLGAKQHGQQVVANMQARIEAIRKQLIQQPARAATKKSLYMTPTGVTSGPGTIVHEMLETAGLANFQRATGWRSMPLERLAYKSPDLIAMAFFNTRTDHANVWTPMRHPVAQQELAHTPTIALQGAWTACGGWFLLDAIESLHQAAVTQ